MKHSTGWVVVWGGAAGLLSACAPVPVTVPVPVSRVILLPEDNGKPTAVVVSTRAGSQQLSKPYQMAEITPEGQVTPGTTTEAAVKERYGAMLSQLPPRPEQFLLYFQPGGSTLTAESKALLPTILANARSRKGGEITVIGHTDRVGALQANDALSLGRAQAVRDLLVAQGFNADLIEAVGRGERAPLVPTEDEVAEPKNRRAEVVVH